MKGRNMSHPTLIEVSCSRADRRASREAYETALRQQRPVLSVRPIGRWANVRLDLFPSALNISGPGWYQALHLQNLCLQRKWVKPRSLTGVGRSLIDIDVKIT